MAYDLIRQRFPGAPCALGARVRLTETGETGNIAPPRAGDDGLRVKVDGRFPPIVCDPRRVEYVRAPVVALGERRG
ncbi:hypothetical protein [Methylorubrum thiocyanatum]|jgi:hypothetical protein|uniref:hypothetical protein n=1 Tax=Methylorubrum thiocyanatum TaxID=47958 RepID=UPI003F7E40EC